MNRDYGAYEAHRVTKIFSDRDHRLFQQLYYADALEKRISLSRQTKEELAIVLAANQEERSKRNYDAWE